MEYNISLMPAKYDTIFLILLIEIEYELVPSPSKNSIIP